MDASHGDQLKEKSNVRAARGALVLKSYSTCKIAVWRAAMRGTSCNAHTTVTRFKTLRCLENDTEFQNHGSSQCKQFEIVTALVLPPLSLLIVLT